MTDLAIRTEHDSAEIARLLGLNPRDPKTQAMVAVCQQYDLDPLLKHVVVIPQGGVYITRDGLLHVAHRSGQLDGIVIESGPELVDGEWRVVVSVYRKDMSRPFTFPGRYPAAGGNRKYAPEMALKVAECMALRRAFDVSGLAVQEEVEVGNQPAADHRPVERTTTAHDPRWDSSAGSDRGEAVEPAEVVEAEVVDESPAGPRRPFMDSPDGPPTQKQMGMLGALLKGQTREQALALVGTIVGRDIASRDELTKAETSRVIDALKKAEASA